MTSRSLRSAGMTVMLILALLFALPAAAQDFPKLTGRVVDQAGLLTPQQVAEVDAKLASLDQRTGRQFVVATVKDLQGLPIEDYGYRLGRAWGIGSAEEDDGVILLVAPTERKVRIETGYGAGVFLTDLVSGAIIRDDITPRFKAGDFAGGINAGVDAIIKQMELPPEEAQKRLRQAEQQASARSESGPGFFPIVFWILIILFVILPMVRGLAGGRRYKGKRRRGGVDPWVVLWGLNELSRGSGGGWSGGSGWGGGGGFGGGGFSGGGGSFGGGGASGSW